MPWADGSTARRTGAQLEASLIVGAGYHLMPFGKAGALFVETGAARLRFPYDAEIISIAATVATAPAGASVIVDVNKNGTTVFTTQANRPTIVAGANASADKVPDVISITAGDYLTTDVDQVGISPNLGADLTIAILYRVV